MREGMRLTNASSIVRLQEASAIDPNIYGRPSIRIVTNKATIEVRRFLPHQHNMVQLAGPFSNFVMAAAHLKALFSHLGTLNTDLEFQL